MLFAKKRFNQALKTLELGKKNEKSKNAVFFIKNYFNENPNRLDDIDKAIPILIEVCLSHEPNVAITLKDNSLELLWKFGKFSDFARALRNEVEGFLFELQELITKATKLKNEKDLLEWENQIYDINRHYLYRYNRIEIGMRHILTFRALGVEIETCVEELNFIENRADEYNSKIDSITSSVINGKASKFESRVYESIISTLSLYFHNLYQEAYGLNLHNFSKEN